MSTRLNYIDGEFREPTSGEYSDVTDPATGGVIGRAPSSDRQDVAVAVAAARRAFDEGSWLSTTALERGRLLFRLAAAVRARSEELAALETMQSGKPIRESELDIEDAATCFEYYGGLANKIHGDVIPAPHEALTLALREPVGVVGQIIPWNFPLLMAAWNLAPAICAGCTCVLKPAEETPLTILDLALGFSDAGLPEGVVNIVTGPGPAGAAIVEDPDVDMVAFTGSLEVGKIVMRRAADTVKKVTLELGGKSPSIFFPDADFEAAVDGALFGVFLNQGECCSAGSRILVHRSIYDSFLDAMVEKAQRIRVGPGLDRSTQMGAMVSQRHFERVRGYQELGKREAKLAFGGGIAKGAGLERGFFLEPTIFYNVDNSARIAQEEIFGPVACVIPFDDEEEAVQISNATYYGLAAAVWTRDIQRTLRIVKRLRAGVVWVNHSQLAYVEAPWGGYKQSGFGRALGRWGVEEYLQTKQVFLNLSGEPVGWF